MYREIVTMHARYLVGLLRLVAGVAPRDVRLDFDDFPLPDTDAVREAERLAATRQSPTIAAHCERAWWFGVALASHDRVELDLETFRISCLLHDIGLEDPPAERCFTLPGGQLAASLDPRAADAIVAHLTPGITVEAHGAEAVYLQQGSLVDVGGWRLWDMAPSTVREVLASQPRDGLPLEMADRWDTAARRDPAGRAQLLRRAAGLSLVIRLDVFTKASRFAQGR